MFVASHSSRGSTLISVAFIVAHKCSPCLTLSSLAEIVVISITSGVGSAVTIRVMSPRDATLSITTGSLLRGLPWLVFLCSEIDRGLIDTFTGPDVDKSATFNRQPVIHNS